MKAAFAGGATGDFALAQLYRDEAGEFGGGGRGAGRWAWCEEERGNTARARREVMKTVRLSDVLNRAASTPEDAEAKAKELRVTS